MTTVGGVRLLPIKPALNLFYGYKACFDPCGMIAVIICHFVTQ